MTPSSIFVFDIETFPKNFSENAVLNNLMDHKLRNVPPEQKASKKLHFSFHEPQYANVISISTLYTQPDGQIFKNRFFSREDEPLLLDDFIDYITSYENMYKNCRYVHFNGLDFDVPFILYKCAQHGIEPPPRFCNLTRFRTDYHYDIMQVLSAWGRFAVSLGEACINFEVSSSKDMLKNLDTLTFLQQATDAEIAEYNSADAESTYELYKKVSKIYK